jgi:hypothetical protein
MERTSRNIAVCILIVFFFGMPLPGQVSTGDLTGRITDTSGAVVPNATVTARNAATGQSRTTQTNALGDYTLPQLPPGTYEVSAEFTGFSKALRKDVEVSVGTRQTLNFDLMPGGITEVVEVQAPPVAIETTKSVIAGVVSPTEIQNLPLITRTFANLSVIMPEARPVGTFDPTKTHVGNVAMNGGDGRQLDVNVDGGDDKDNVVGSLLQNFAYESIQEFQVLQHRWTAESGRAVGGVVNVVTKSGSNDFHGSFFSNFRDNALRRRDFFERQTTDPKPDFSRQEFGGSAGGPIVKEKLFVFGALEHFRERQNILVNPSFLPQLAAIPGVQPASVIPLPYDDTMYTIKLDQPINSRHSVFYRYSQQSNSSPNDQFDPTQPADPTGGNTNNNKLYSFVFNHTFTVSSRQLNQFTAHFQDFTNKILAITDKPNVLFPSVQTGANANVPQKTTERKFQFRDDFSWQLPRHDLKFGTNYIRTKLGGFFFFGAKGYQITFFDDPLTILNNKTKYPQGFATPGAVQEITFNDGAGDTTQRPFHQLALYFQDDYKVTPRLTLNLGVRWDANIRMLPDQTNNRTMRILSQLNEPRAQAITGDRSRLSNTTPSWKEFQPRMGFAFDPNGRGRTVIRGGYGIFFDQIFQNLTLFSLQQTNPTIYQTVLDLVNSDVGAGQLAAFRYGIDPLPAPPGGARNTDLEIGAFGRINDPGMKDPYVQKASLGFQTTLGPDVVLSSDYVHTLGIHESRVLNINPLLSSLCNPAFPGSNPASSRCVRGASTRYFDRAFVDAGLGAGRLEQSNMFAMNNRSRFDSWTTQVRRQTRNMLWSVSYVLSDSRSWGGQPTASYTGNGIAITPENQFNAGEFGPNRIDERHRIVGSGVFKLPLNIQLAPIAQFATARPYSLISGLDIDGDGRKDIDRICAGVSPSAVFAARGNSAALRALNPVGCQQIQVNNTRTGFVVDSSGNAHERSGRYFNIDLRASDTFRIGERLRATVFANFFNLFDTDNLSFADRRGRSVATSGGGFMQPVSLYGPGFGPPVGVPLTLQLGFRVDF